MTRMPLRGVRLGALPLLALLQACSTPHPDRQVVVADNRCPPRLQTGQTLILNLPGQPTTGYRWQLLDSAEGVLESLGPEVFRSPDSDLVGGEGIFTWRFQVAGSGAGRLYLTYARPWETAAEPAARLDCRVEANRS